MNQIANFNQRRNVTHTQHNFQSELSAIVANRSGSDSIEALGLRLTPSKTSEMVDELRPIFSMPSKDQGEVGELATIKGFCIALDGFPLQIIIETRDDFLRNNVKGQSLDFRPTPPRFKKVCEDKIYDAVLKAMLAAGPIKKNEDAA